MLKKLYKNYKIFQILIVISIGFLRLFNNLFIIVLSRIFVNKNSINFVFIGPVHSPHFNYFILKLRKHYVSENIKICLINSDPNYLVNSFNFKNILVDRSIYKLFGYNLQRTDWQHNLFINGVNKIGNLSKKYIEFMISAFKPQIIWVHDLQSGGYLCEHIIDRYKSKYPKTTICGSAWGNDLYYFKDLPLHAATLRSILKSLDFLHIESKREHDIALNLDFKGIFFPVSSITMTEIGSLRKFENDIKPEEKDIFLVVKGSYEFRSNILSLVTDIESDINFWQFKSIHVINATDEDIFHMMRIKYKYNLDIQCSKSHSLEDFVSILSRSRFFLTLNLSDGVNNSAVYAAYVNCIPIMSNHTGLSTYLNASVSDFIVFDFSSVKFSHLFYKLLELSDREIHSLLMNLKLIFENFIFNDKIQRDILDEVLHHVKRNK